MTTSTQQLDQVFGALADPTRRAILARLAAGEATVNELVALSNFSQPTISNHLKVLERAGLVSRGRNAQFRPVRLNPVPLAGAAHWLGNYREFWEASLDQLDAYVSDLQAREDQLTSKASRIEPVAERELVIRRVFDAPARLLFEAYSKPEHLTRWFGPPGWTLTLCEMDFQTGGRLRLAMTGLDGIQGPAFDGEYLDIVPNQKITYAGAFETPDAETMTVTITFNEQVGQTTVTIHTVFASVAMKNEHLGMGYAEGLAAGLDQLADIISELSAQGRS